MRFCRYLCEQCDFELFFVPNFRLSNVTGAPSRVTEASVGPGLDGPVFEFEGNPEDGLVEESRLLKVSFVVVSWTEVAVGPGLLNPIAECRGKLEVLHVTVDGSVEVPHRQVDGTNVADLSGLLKCRQNVLIL